MHGTIQASIQTRADIEQVRRDTRTLATSVGFGRDDAELIALAVSELATNLLHYACQGVISVRPVSTDQQTGIQVESRDVGPGIQNVERAMQDDFSTGKGMGSGLPAVRRMMDAFDIQSSPAGTTIVAHKWLTQNKG